MRHVVAATDLSYQPYDEMVLQTGRRGLFTKLYDTRYVPYKKKKDCRTACEKAKPAGKYSAIDAGTFPSSGSKNGGPTMCRVRYEMSCNGGKSLSLYGKVEDGYCRALHAAAGYDPDQQDMTAGYASKMYEDFDCVCALKTLDIEWKTITPDSTSYCPIGWSLFTFNRNKYMCNVNGSSKCAVCRDPSRVYTEQYSFGYIFEVEAKSSDQEWVFTVSTCLSADNFIVNIAETKDMAVLCERNG